MTAPVEANQYGPESYKRETVEEAFFGDVPLDTRLAATEAGVLLAEQLRLLRAVEGVHPAAEAVFFFNHLGEMLANGLPAPLVGPVLDGIIAMSLMAIRAYDALEEVEA